MRDLQARYAAEAAGACSPAVRARAKNRQRTWLRAELALLLLAETGRRRGAIMGLEWRDIDFTSEHITWRPEHDKKRKTWVTPYPASLFAEIRALQRQLDVVGGFVFPGQRDPTRPAPAELLSQWIAKAEEAAGLPKLDGGTCHPYRRRWRTDRNHMPIKSVAVAGGWSDIGTMLRCYDHPDDAAILAVTSETKRRRDRPD